MSINAMAPTSPKRLWGWRWGVSFSRRLSSEQGIALPAALMMLLIFATIAIGVMATTVTSSHQSNRDRNVKRAIAAADAGLEAATYRLNKLPVRSLECVVTGAVQGATELTIEPVQPDGWCREQTEDLGEGASFSYRVKGGAQVNVNGQNLIQRKIVATGTVNGVKRRLATVIGSDTGLTLFGGYGVISLEDLTLPNSTSIQGNTASNGHITLTNTAEICGLATVGPGKQFTTSQSGHLCPGNISNVAEQPFVLNPVDQGTAASSNNNANIGLTDIWTRPDKIVWDAPNRYLRLGQLSSLTLNGDIYSFCSLEIDNNATLSVGIRLASRPPVKIFIDSPENCPGVPNAGNVILRNGGQFTNLNANPTTVQLFMNGSTTAETSLSFDNNFATAINMLIYAPRSTVSFLNHTRIVGAVAAKQVQMANNTTIIWDRRSDDITIDDLLPHYDRQSYVECAAVATGPPDSAC
jgi:hypothetical protein